MSLICTEYLCPCGFKCKLSEEFTKHREACPLQIFWWLIPKTSAENPATPPIYKLTLVTGEVDRTFWWKNQDRKEPANVWWLEGGGESRPATVVEIELWQRLQAAYENQIVRNYPKQPTAETK